MEAGTAIACSVGTSSVAISAVAGRAATVPPVPAASPSPSPAATRPDTGTMAAAGTARPEAVPIPHGNHEESESANH